MKKIPLPIIFIIIAILYIAANIYISSKNSDRQTISVFSQSPFGLSVFNEFANRIPESTEVSTKKTALLTEELAGDILLIQSPKRSLSDHEVNILDTLIRKEGKTAILTFHDQPSYDRLKDAFLALGMTTPIEENSDFSNFEAQIASPMNNDSKWFNPQNQYAFYGLLRFNDQKCDLDPFQCNVREMKLDNGHLIVIASISPLANSLIGLNGNHSFAESLLLSQQPIVIDEYHNFFTDKTTWDLLMLPELSIPLLGFVGLMIIYALFGYHRDEVTPPTLTTPGEALHQVNSELLSGLLSRPDQISDGIELQAKALIRHFPEREREIKQVLDSNLQPVMRGLQLIQIHRMALRDRGYSRT